jgi:TonB-linked SusC/RagA family outer membrane protein
MALARQLLLALVCALLGTAGLSAQNSPGTIAGRVVDAATQEPLAGAGVSVASRTTITGPDGRFSIAGIAAGSYTVRVSRISYTPATQSVTVAAGGTATVEIALTPGQAVVLESVVAVGYGQRRVRDVTGSVTAVSAGEFNTGRVVSPEQLIQSKVAGVQVVDNGEPGGGMNIRIRGGTSVNASNEPLFVVDGVPLAMGGGPLAGSGGLSAGRNPLNFINPNDIARVTVLKDASSTAIYGSRGANGVVIIETKTGTQGANFEYSNSFSTSRIVGEPDFLSAEQFRGVVQEFAPERMNLLGTTNTDWRDAVQRDGVGQEHQFAVAGSGDNMNYRLSLGYLDQEGVIRGSSTERLSGSLNYSHRLFANRLNVRATVRGARTRDQFTPGGVLGAATVFDPTQPIRNAQGGWFEQPSNLPLAPNNPVAELALALDDGTTYRSIGSLEAQYRLPFLEQIATTLRIGYDAAQSERRGFLPSTLQAQIENRTTCSRGASDPPCPTGQISRSTPDENTGVIDAFANYTSRIARWNSDIDATAGYSYESTHAESPFFQARGLSTDLLGPNGVPSAQEVVSRLSVRDNKLASFFGRVNYTLADRYLLTLSVRRDGSSRFAPGNQWGTFPAAALAWRVSDEGFMDNVEWVSDLKLRGSWGVNGNQAIGDYLWVPDYRYGDAFTRVQFGNEFVTTIRPTAVDPDIKWEETTSYNLGLDYGLFNDRLTGAVEYYHKDTDDLIFRVPVAAGTYVSNFVTTNVGSVRNQGVEFSINARVLDGGRGGFRYDASFNAARNHNELLRVNAGSGSQRIEVGDIAGGQGSRIQVLQPGYAINSFFVYHHNRDARGRPVYSDVNGDGTVDDLDLYEDRNDDGKITQDDRAAFRSPAPEWLFGHTSQFGFRSLDLSFTLRANLGNYVYNNQASNQGYYNALKNAGGLTNLHASVLEYGFMAPQFFSDVYVEDASFLRMDNVTLGWTLPAVRGVQRARVYGTVQNAFTVTGYSGVDPTAGLNGIDNNIYPRSRTFSAGVSLGF